MGDVSDTKRPGDPAENSGAHSTEAVGDEEATPERWPGCELVKGPDGPELRCSRSGLEELLEAADGDTIQLTVRLIDQPRTSEPETAPEAPDG